MKRMKTNGKNDGRLENEEVETTSLDSDDLSVKTFDKESWRLPVSAVTGKNTYVTFS